MTEAKNQLELLNKNKKKASVIQFVAILYITVWTITPQLQLDLIFRLMTLGFAGIWFLSSIGSGGKASKEEVYGFAFVLLIVIVSIIENKNFSKVLYSISYYMVFIGALMANRYRYGDKLMRILPVIVMVLFTIFNFNTWIELLTNPTVARMIVRDDVETYDFLRKGIGGYGLIYSQVCVFPLFLGWSLKALRKNLFKGLIGITWTVSYVLLVMEAGYSIAVIASIIGIIMLFFYKGQSPVLALIIGMVLFFIGVAMILYWDAFRNFLLDIFEGTKVVRKINDLVGTAESGVASGSIASRMDRYGSTIRTFFRYPLTGGLWWDGGGGHSAVGDTFAKYGILGGIIYTKMYMSVPNHFKKTEAGMFFRKTVNATIVTMLFIGILDAVPYQLTFTSTIVAATFFGDMLIWEKK